MSLLAEVTRYVPQTWSHSGREQFIVPRHSDEYDEIENAFRRQGVAIRSVHRYENALRYAQFLVRQQHLKARSPTRTLYTVRRFVRVDGEDKERAIRYNLDSRRCPGADFTFRRELNGGNSEYIFIVSVVTEAPSEQFSPARDSDYYIEYIVELA